LIRNPIWFADPLLTPAQELIRPVEIRGPIAKIRNAEKTLRRRIENEGDVQLGLSSKMEVLSHPLEWHINPGFPSFLPASPPRNCSGVVYLHKPVTRRIK
tara:strand:+ start:232 stop:531 length:300 start_codon:yes stop_codon:yes gene_type:complete